MNSHILVGYTFDKKHKVVLDSVSYAEVKKTFHGIKESDEFTKLEIWSRSNGLEKSKHLKKPTKKIQEKISDVEILDEEEDFEIEPENVDEQPKTHNESKK